MKKGSKFACIILFFVLISSGVFGQNIFFDSDQNGPHVAGSYSRTDGVTSVGVEVGQTWNGRFTGALGIGLNRFDGQTIATSYGLGLNYLVLKQEDRAPLSIGLGGFYTFIDISDSQLKASQYGISTSLYHEIRGDSFSIIPSIYVIAGFSRLSFSGFSETEGDVVFGGQLFIRRSANVYLAPSVQIQDDETIFLITLGFFFPNSAQSHESAPWRTGD